MANRILRFGVSIEEKLLHQFDGLISDKGYVNRSEAIRDLIRDALVREEASSPASEVIGNLTLVYSHVLFYNQETVYDIQHDNYRSIISAVHVHLDEHNCLEVLILKGPSQAVKKIADRLLSIKNVRHGKLTITTAGGE